MKYSICKIINFKTYNLKYLCLMVLHLVEKYKMNYREKLVLIVDAMIASLRHAQHKSHIPREILMLIAKYIQPYYGNTAFRFGGSNESYDPIRQSSYQFDVGANKWMQLADIPTKQRLLLQ